MGRTVAQAILPRFNHARLLLASVLASVFGCLILGTTNNLQGAFVGILLIGASYGARLGGSTLLSYFAVGTAGLPVFAKGAGLA